MASQATVDAATPVPITIRSTYHKIANNRNVPLKLKVTVIINIAKSEILTYRLF